MQAAGQQGGSHPHEPAFEADPRIFDAALEMAAPLVAKVEQAPSEGTPVDSAPGEQARTSRRRVVMRVIAVALALGTAVVGYQLLTPKPKPLAGMEPAGEIAAMPMEPPRGNPAPAASAQVFDAPQEPAPRPAPAQRQEVVMDRATGEVNPAASPSALGSPATSASTSAMEQRLAALEAAVADLRSRASAPSALAAPGNAATPGAERRGPSTSAHAQQHDTGRKPANRAVRPAVAEPVVAPPAPTIGGQLLSVDMWGGQVSVVVTTGLPGDTRTRTLKPGDSLNGVTLQSADPGSQTATFSAGGRSFTLSSRQGG